MVIIEPPGPAVTEGRTQKPAVSGGFKADDGTRTHDLLHGKWRQIDAAGFGEPRCRLAKPLPRPSRCGRFHPPVDIPLTSPGEESRGVSRPGEGRRKPSNVPRFARESLSLARNWAALAEWAT
jgi:hypothetical protein